MSSKSIALVIVSVVLMLAALATISPAGEIIRTDLKWSGLQGMYMNLSDKFAWDITGFVETPNRPNSAELDAGPVFAVGDGKTLVVPMIGFDFSQNASKLKFGLLYPMELFVFRTTDGIHYELWNVSGYDPSTGLWMLSERLLVTKPLGSTGFRLGAQGDGDLGSHVASKFEAGPLVEFKSGSLTISSAAEFGQDHSRFLISVVVCK